jgi:D-glycero-beta-D-manno-heptose-7-phosphate kinase
MPHTWRQQVVRVDREPDAAPDRHTARELALATREYLRASDALLVSDYGYGAATPQILAAARDRRRTPRPGSSGKSAASYDSLPVVLDSRHRMLEFSGITSATPNEPEVEEALEMKIGNDWNELCSAGEQIISRMNLSSLVITRGRDGMIAFPGKHKPVEIPVFGSDQVTDVTGAGDTVIAAFTAALAAGADAEDAARLANYAGGIVVMKRGTATVSQQELLDALEKSASGIKSH